jgi:thiosulfate reductase cytochrome b subunit
LTKKFGQCYFRVTAFYVLRKVAFVSQTILLEDFSLLISAGLACYQASADLQCFGSQYIIIELHFIDLKDLQSGGCYDLPSG